MTKRREFIKHLSLISALPFLARFSSNATGRVFSNIEIKRLKDLAKAKNLFYGCAVNNRIFNDYGYDALIAGQCNMIVCENAMKWAALRPTPHTFDFGIADTYLQFAEKNKIQMRGHNLCWHESIPKWLAATITTTNAQEMLTEHIERVVKHYAGQMHSWDVVNEAIDIHANNDSGLRTKSIWFEMLGEEYIEIAFKTAAANDNKALMTYNDYGLETDSEKRRRVLDLIDRLKTKGIRIDALGTQAHLDGVGFVNNFSANEYQLFLNDAADMGLKIFITELDVNDQQLPNNNDDRDLGVAHVYRDFLNVALTNPAVYGLLTWGITDRYSWLDHIKPRTDRLPQRPLPFDEHLQPKAAFNAIADVFERLK